MTEGVSDGKEAGGALKMNQEKRENMRWPDNGRTSRIESRACLSATCAYVCVCVFAGPPTGHKGWKQTHTGANTQTKDGHVTARTKHKALLQD